jgi:hypothetical protein
LRKPIQSDQLRCLGVFVFGSNNLLKEVHSTT